MRILVVGAGAVGGYFGARLLQAGRDVTFLVRARRAEALAAGLFLESPRGDFHAASPPLVTAETLKAPYDLVLLSCKAYDLAAAANSFAPAVGPRTAILPLLNGMAHLDVLSARFGAERVLGGQCVISATLDSRGHIIHLNDAHSISFGERGTARTPRADAIAAALSNAAFDLRLSENILLDMWNKWIFIAAAAGITTLMRGAIGDIARAGGSDLAAALFEECAAIALRAQFPPPPPFKRAVLGQLSQTDSAMAASMLRDIERRGRIEADHIVGDLLARGGDVAASPLLRIAYAHLKTYEARRARDEAAMPAIAAS